MLQRVARLRKNRKEWWEESRDSVFWACTAFLGAVLMAGLLRIALLWQERSPIQVEERQINLSETDVRDTYMAASGLPGLVATSRNGTRYYYPWCGGFSRVKEANKVWFPSAQAAEKAGYTIASGCEGL